MKKIKRIYANSIFYVNSETNILHGLWNDLKNVDPVGIGYLYQNKPKGFWLKVNK